MTMTELRKTYPAYFASKNKIELTPAIDVDKVLREMKSRYANEKVNDADGVKIDFRRIGYTCANRIRNRSSAYIPKRKRWRRPMRWPGGSLRK